MNCERKSVDFIEQTGDLVTRVSASNFLSKLLALPNENSFRLKTCEHMNIVYDETNESMTQIDTNNQYKIHYADKANTKGMDVWFDKKLYAKFLAGRWVDGLPKNRPFSKFLPQVCYGMLCEYLRQKNVNKIKTLFDTIGIGFDCIPRKSFKSKRFCKKLTLCKELFPAYFAYCERGANGIYLPAEFVRVLSLYNNPTHVADFVTILDGKYCLFQECVKYCSCAHIADYILDDVTFVAKIEFLLNAIRIGYNDTICKKILYRIPRFRDYSDSFAILDVLFVCFQKNKLKLLIHIFEQQKIMRPDVTIFPYAYDDMKCVIPDDNNIEDLRTIFRLLTENNKIQPLHGALHSYRTNLMNYKSGTKQ